MTTEELEKKLKISKKTCIHCPTEELAKQVLTIFHHLGLKWCNGTHYTSNYNWYSYKENVVYYPFEGECSSLNYARLIDYKIINAKEFIMLHTVKEKYNLQNYTPKGELEGFPKEIIACMLNYQEEQGNERNVTIFEKWIEASQFNEGFAWNKTKEDREFWDDVIRFKNFNRFFEKYPKQEYQDNPQEFRVGDEVIDIITGRRGKIFQISINGNSNFPIHVSFNEGENYYTLNGRHFTRDKYPRLLHYRDDYDYSIIDFNNLPFRQEPKRWRAEKGGEYYFLRFSLEGWLYTYATKENNDSTDNINYNSGNYFRTEAEAEIIAQKLNTYFKQLIQEEHE